MNDTWVTLQGWVGGEVSRRDAGGVPLATFRLGSTPRYVKDGGWVDGTTSWYTVNAWRALADHVADSVRKGDPLIVHGRLRAEIWERDGHPPQVSYTVEASTLGHDLAKGTSTFAREPRRDAAGTAEPSPQDASEQTQAEAETAAETEAEAAA